MSEGDVEGKIDGIDDGKLDGVAEGDVEGKVDGIDDGKLDGVAEGDVEEYVNILTWPLLSAPTATVFTSADMDTDIPK